eukprot:6202691-Pleurochrysis_carterae.AAC.1
MVEGRRSDNGREKAKGQCSLPTTRRAIGDERCQEFIMCRKNGRSGCHAKDFGESCRRLRRMEGEKSAKTREEGGGIGIKGMEGTRRNGVRVRREGVRIRNACGRARAQRAALRRARGSRRGCSCRALRAEGRARRRWAPSRCGSHTARAHKSSGVRGQDRIWGDVERSIRGYLKGRGGGVCGACGLLDS